jgi:hypothetical protein
MQVRRQTLSLLIVSIAKQRWAPLEKHKTGRNLKLQAILKIQTGKARSAIPFLCFFSLYLSLLCILLFARWILTSRSHRTRKAKERVQQTS